MSLRRKDYFYKNKASNANYVETNPISTSSDILNALSDGELLVTIFSTLNEKAAIALWNNTPVSYINKLG